MINNKKGILITVFVGILVVAFFISGSDVLAAKTEVITDVTGRELEVPARIERIVATGPGAVRLVVYLQAEEMLVGVEDFEKDDNKRPYILANPELTELSSIGPQFGGDAELITAARPDIILSTYTNAEKARALQQKTGIPVVVLVEGGAGTMYIESLREALRLTAALLDREQRAEEVLDYYQEAVTDIEERTEDIETEEQITAYIGGIGQKGAKGLVSTEPAYLPFEYVNIDNVASEVGLTHTMIDPEKLLEWDPEYIFIDQGGYELTIKDLQEKKYQYLTAYKEKDIYTLLPYNYYTTNFGTLLANSYYLGKIIYPSRFADIEPAAKADEIYSFFTGKGVYEDMKSIFGGYGKLDIMAEID